MIKIAPFRGLLWIDVSKTRNFIEIPTINLATYFIYLKSMKITIMIKVCCDNDKISLKQLSNKQNELRIKLNFQ